MHHFFVHIENPMTSTGLYMGGIMEKRIVCFGDSNTWGYNTENHSRFPESVRWTRKLQALLPEYAVVEEGLCGRTTVFADPLNDGMRGLDYLKPCLSSHSPLHALIITLGTNDCKERYSATAKNIAQGMQRLVRLAKQAEVWLDIPNIIVVAPPPMPKGVENGFYANEMGKCSEKSYHLARHYESIAHEEGVLFLNLDGIADMNEIDFMHFTPNSMDKIAAALAKLVKEHF